MCDGTYPYPRKNGGAIRPDKPIIIICGNASIETVYPKTAHLVHSRFIEVDVSLYY